MPVVMAAWKRSCAVQARGDRLVVIAAQASAAAVAVVRGDRSNPGGRGASKPRARLTGTEHAQHEDIAGVIAWTGVGRNYI